jgi:hypothetical protein
MIASSKAIRLFTIILLAWPGNFPDWRRVGIVISGRPPGSILALASGEMELPLKAKTVTRDKFVQEVIESPPVRRKGWKLMVLKAAGGDGRSTE